MKKNHLSKTNSSSPHSLQCRTKYPIILVHGTGFRDRKILNYWGRIPKALMNEGAEVYYSHQDAWGTIEANAKMVKTAILDVLDKTGCDKINILAHSKGGLEARYMIHELEMGDKVASLTTISTPHNGSKTMDFLLKMPKFLYRSVSLFVNLYFKILGDINPDFYNTCHQFTTVYSKEFNHKIINYNGTYYQSYASAMKNSFSDIFLSLPHLFVKKFDGINDGIVSIESAKWGEFKGVIRGNQNRGVSHADIVDMRRKNFSGIDIREIYISIVKDLKQKGF